eukprot:9745167-Heterocapsa_arctica.AAC.1
MIEEDEEDHDDAEATAVEPQKSALTEEAVKGMAMMVTKEVMDRLQSVETKMEEITTTHDHTKQTMIMGFTDMERSFEAAHDYNKYHFKIQADDIKGVKHLVKDLPYKRKSDEMDKYHGEEEEELTDEENEKHVGAQDNDMTRFQRAEVIKWMDDNPERKEEAAMDFDMELVKDKK